MTERFIRHGNVLTVVSIVDDPIYLEEPFIRTTNWVLNPGMEIRRTQFDVVDEVAGRQKGDVPHYLPGSPGALQKLKEFATRVGLPPAAARGGAATMYPEYQRTMNVPGTSSYTAAAQRLARADARAETDTTLRVVHVQGKVHMIVGDGGNIVVQAGDEGVLVIDTGLEARGDELLAAIRRISDKPIRFVINTHVHADHTGANELTRPGWRVAGRQRARQLGPGAGHRTRARARAGDGANERAIRTDAAAAVWRMAHRNVLH